MGKSGGSLEDFTHRLTARNKVLSSVARVFKNPARSPLLNQLDRVLYLLSELETVEPTFTIFV